jgi:hypothetical protein
MTTSQTQASTIELAESAARAVRELNHRTRAQDTFTGPADLYWHVAELVLLVGGLPQLLGQLAHWLDTEHDAGRVRSDNATDPGPAVADATAELADAGAAARDLSSVLARAQQHLAHLGAATA